ncbi:PaaX family transcriptional regulator C-terminal domain-containing protein [Paenibacillus sp. GCM10027628]|uniref:PaaX family transcriptional regulator C-terminal domain-containing protein n=1 Tax=Paenibacillus sp. GCM10027628 TaxID=3273413 RepID=UPI0036322898
MLSIEKQLLFLLSRTDSMDAQELIRIYEKRNYSAPYIRNSLAKLKKEGFAVTPSRSRYQITDEGRSFIQSINHKPELYQETWDHKWHLVMLQIPESERKKRDQFRSEMAQIGFGLLYNSVYISPWIFRHEVGQLIDKHGLSGQVTQFHGAMLDTSIAPSDAASIWSLDQVAGTYRDKLHWFTTEFEPNMQKTLHHHAEPLTLFTAYLHLGEVISELYLADPMLPKELLPPDWECRSILRKLQNYLQALIQAIPADSLYAAFLRS